MGKYTDHELTAFYETQAEEILLTPEGNDQVQARSRFVVTLVKGVSGIIRALDVGCGDGYVCSLLNRLGAVQVHGCDLSTTRIARAIRLLPEASFLRCTAYNLPYRNREFDVVVCSEVLEHLDDPERALFELARISSNLVVLTVPSAQKLTATVCPHCLRKFHLDGHIQSFDAARLTRLCRDAGLLVIKVRYFPYYRWSRPIRRIPLWIYSTYRGRILGDESGFAHLGVVCRIQGEGAGTPGSSGHR